MHSMFYRDKLLVKSFPGRREMGEEAARDAAEQMQTLLRHNEYINVIFAAAPSQDELLEALRQQPVEWCRVNAFHMDEYHGLSSEAPQRFGNYLKEHFFGKVALRNVFYLGLPAGSDEEECARYTALLKKYPPHVVFLGIGENGHIAFNDPHVADFADPCLVKVVDLDLTCRLQQVHDGCFPTLFAVPTHAYTLTVPALVSAPYMFCVVPGKSKARAVHAALYDEISEACPAGILRTKEHAVLYLDPDSAELLED